MTRDTWSDAHVAATQELLEGDIAAVRRRLRVQSALGLVLAGVVLLGAFYLIEFVIDPDKHELWAVSLQALHASLGLMGLGFVLVIVGAIRTSGAGRPFVGPDAFLTRTDRAWLRTQIAEGRPVPDERREVVADSARLMVVEGRYIPTYLGFVVLYIGMLVGGPSLASLVVSSVLIVWMLVRVVRGTVWSRRARRWLAQNT